MGETNGDNKKKTAREIIENYNGPKVRIMEVCGTHTHEIFRLGIRKLLPEQVELISGPGCPVCVTPVSFIDEAIYLALEKGVTICTFGDLVRVPGTKMSLAGIIIQAVLFCRFYGQTTGRCRCLKSHRQKGYLLLWMFFRIFFSICRRINDVDLSSLFSGSRKAHLCTRHAHQITKRTDRQKRTAWIIIPCWLRTKPCRRLMRH